jgi:hypothetical protein
MNLCSNSKQWLCLLTADDTGLCLNAERYAVLSLLVPSCVGLQVRGRPRGMRMRCTGGSALQEAVCRFQAAVGNTREM